MSIDPVPQVLGSAAGSPAAQTASDAARAGRSASAARARVASASGGARPAEVAQDGGKDMETGDRDPDGRMAWVFAQAESPAERADQAPPKNGRQPSVSDVRGRTLDEIG